MVVKKTQNNILIVGGGIGGLTLALALHEKGIKVNDIIIGINKKESSWNNLTQSLRFATLGENLILEFYTFSDKFKTHEFEYTEEKT